MSVVKTYCDIEKHSCPLFLCSETFGGSPLPIGKSPYLSFLVQLPFQRGTPAIPTPALYIPVAIRPPLTEVPLPNSPLLLLDAGLSRSSKIYFKDLLPLLKFPSQSSLQPCPAKTIFPSSELY
jgi:hypothetical protein